MNNNADMTALISSYIQVEAGIVSSLNSLVFAYKKNKGLANFAEQLKKERGKIDKFNLFEFFGAHRETFHSGVLRWILDPDSSHELGFTPLCLFIRLLNQTLSKQNEIDELDFMSAEVEVTCESNNIDVLIETANDCIIIENKINWAADQAQQLARYYRAMEERGKRIRAVVYLTRYRHPPSPQSLDDLEDKIRPILINLSFYSPSPDPDKKDGGGLADGVIDKIIADGSISHIDILSFMRQYSVSLKKTRREYMSAELTNKIFEELFIKDGKIDQEAFEAGMCIKELDWRYPILEKMMRNVMECADKRTTLTGKIEGGSSGRLDSGKIHVWKYSTSKHWCLAFTIGRAGEVPSFGLDTYDRRGGISRAIEIYYRGDNNDDYEAVINAVRPVAENHQLTTEKTYRVFLGSSQEGIQYVSKEDTFYDILLDTLEALLKAGAQ